MTDKEPTPGELPNSVRSSARGDTGSVSHSHEGRDVRTDMAAQLASDALPADVEEAGLTDEEIAIYRRRVAEGFYSSREVAAEVARRMIRSRDI